MKIALVSLVGGKSERESLRFSGNHGIRAQMLINDTLNKPNHGNDITAFCITGMNNFQKPYVDSVMADHGFSLCCMSPDFRKQKGKYRYTQLTAAYCSDSLEAKNIRYKESTVSDLKYRYAAFSLPNNKHLKEVRVLHVPCCETDKPHVEDQLDRKQRLMKMERTLELYEKRIGKGGIISCGDYNTEVNGNGAAQEIFDSLPYTKLLDEPTWNDKKLDNVLISDDLKPYVKAYTCDYRVGMTSDHKTVIIEVSD